MFLSVDQFSQEIMEVVGINIIECSIKTKMKEN
jgi:hypothetical protein